MRILLVKPKAQLAAVLGLQGFSLLEPLELGYLAAVVPRAHEVEIVDLRLARNAERTFRRALERVRPDLVGITGYTHEGSVVKRLARLARAWRPGVRVVVGGHHATVAPEDYAIDDVDAVVRGEGCRPFAAIVEALQGGGDLAGIPQVLLPRDGVAPADALEWPRFPDPAELPRPRRDLWDHRRYRTVWMGEHLPDWHPLFPPVSMVRSSWGCRAKCTFCVVPFLCGGQHRPRPVEEVVEEVASLATQHVYFSDDENFLDEEFASALAERLAARGVRKRFFGWARASTVNHRPELMRRWREVGLDAVFLGFEFTTDQELRQAHKGSTVAANERALDTLRAMGIGVLVGFMVGAEWSEDHFSKLRQYVRSLPPAQVSITVQTPSPGTPDYQTLRDRIWVPRPHDLHDCMHPLTPTALPLRRFGRLLAEQAAEGTARIPMRVGRHPVRPHDLVRALWADRGYFKGFRDLYRDYPRELWDWPGGTV